VRFEVRGGSVGDGATIGSMAMVRRRGFCGWVVEIITSPYKGEKKIFSRQQAAYVLLK
jgi:hypothetical protein